MLSNIFNSPVSQFAFLECSSNDSFISLSDLYEFQEIECLQNNIHYHIQLQYMNEQLQQMQLLFDMFQENIFQDEVIPISNNFFTISNAHFANIGSFNSLKFLQKFI